METFGDGASIFLIPIGYALFAFGVLAFALGALYPADVALKAAGILSTLIAFMKWHRIATGLMARWNAGNRFVIAQHASQASHLEFMAGAFAGDAGGARQVAEVEPESEERITVNTAQGSYSMPRYSEAEAKEQFQIGECLRFIRIGEKAGKFSHREMEPYRPAGMNTKVFKAWWTAQSDQLVAWGQFAKVEKSGTRPLKPVKEIRAALLSRSFKQPAETVATQTQ